MEVHSVFHPQWWHQLFLLIYKMMIVEILEICCFQRESNRQIGINLIWQWEHGILIWRTVDFYTLLLRNWWKQGPIFNSIHVKVSDESQHWVMGVSACLTQVCQSGRREYCPAVSDADISRFLRNSLPSKYTHIQYWSDPT